ncbi:hypothetical protein F2Q69_00005715 [Brassica cretica]|uniref:Uncharacterized protein n=1 Tax=Brassica cretica TaxID=69181 RepID=A0A8S9P580_BRACR|nr:hypothetical protein F2Q69_00005715 [Brassica cretica]
MKRLFPKRNSRSSKKRRKHTRTLCAALREFYRVSSGVVFRVPVHGESAEDPPEGFCTCHEAFLTPLQNILGVLTLSYELGMDLSPDDFEGLWSTRKTSIDYSYRMAPKRHMSIIQGHTSNAKGWFERFFYVRIDGVSVEENCLPLFRGKWNFHRANSIIPATPRDLFAKRDLLRNGPFFWDSFTLDRIRNAVALYRPSSATRMEPGFHPGCWEAPLPNDFFANLPRGFTTPASLDEASRREVVAEGSRLIMRFSLRKIIFLANLRLSLPCLTLAHGRGDLGAGRPRPGARCPRLRRSSFMIETSSRLIPFSTFLSSHPRKTVFYLINLFPGTSSFQGSIESWFSGNFQALIPS